MTRAFALASVFSSAFLLFLLEPMVGKMLLPDFGGSPAVWGTCLMFFQGLLLLGYGYGHFVSGLSSRRSLVIHALALLVPFAVLPFAATSTHAPAPGAWPVPALLLALASTAALPFFALSTNTSLVQDWYARRQRVEPYFLYAASNAGSLSSLVAYPFLVERFTGLHAQIRLLSLGYLLFVALTAATAWSLSTHTLERRSKVVAAVVPLSRKLRWLALSTIGSLLLLAVSMHVSSEVAAVPLLWVVPLAVYLLTFVIAFLPSAPFPRRILVILVSLFITLGLFFNGAHVRELMALRLVTALGVLFAGCWLCHGDLAAERPRPEEVTSFYLWIAAGGFAGGVFGALVAPVIFHTVAEWPLALVAVAVVAATGDGGKEWRAAFRRSTWWLAAGSMLAAMAATVWLNAAGGRWLFFAGLLPLAVMLAGIIFSRMPGLFAVGSALVALSQLAGLAGGDRPLDVRRNFFGVVRVMQFGPRRLMYHGLTAHGVQMTEPFSPLPLLNYTPDGPFGFVMADQPEGAHMAVVGMGAGSMAALARRGQHLTYYELDPDVEPMAREWFTFLGRSEADLSSVLGDARLTLHQVPDHSLDLLCVDAFSGDAIPAHLLTVEAFRLYLTKLSEHGVLVIHASNRYLDLIPVLEGSARELHLPGAVDHFMPSEEQFQRWAVPSEVVVVAADKGRLDPFFAAGWVPLENTPPQVWTDDRSSILDVFKLKEFFE